MAIGVCRLTGQTGHLVKSHILPAALTSPIPAHLPFAQGGTDHPPIRRRTSWYDATIVTRAGEDILAAYDDWAVAELRRHRLVWSGWGADDALTTSDHLRIPDAPGYGARRIHSLDGTRLRLFFLSVLWRAAVSELVEFGEVSLRPSDVRRLRRMLVTGHAAPLRLFPMRLIQLSTRGDVHNLTPLAQEVPRDFEDPGKGVTPIFRFYMDGLVIHYFRKVDDRETGALGGMIVGGAEELFVPTVPFETSWQRSNMERLIGEVAERWPERLSRIVR